MKGYIIDTSAWIEFFRGLSEGKKVTGYLFPELKSFVVFSKE